MDTRLDATCYDDLAVNSRVRYDAVGHGVNIDIDHSVNELRSINQPQEGNDDFKSRFEFDPKGAIRYP